VKPHVVYRCCDGNRQIWDEVEQAARHLQNAGVI
jgi:hypothetical protein